MKLFSGIQSFLRYSRKPTVPDEHVKNDPLSMLPPQYQVGSYIITKALSEGCFGSVYVCEHKETKKEYAAKFFDNDCLQDEENMNMIQSEVSILKAMSNKHTISFADMVHTQDGIFIVMELVEGFELAEMYSEGFGLTETFARTIFEQLLEAIQHMHDLGIVHRDIKAENVMIDTHGNLKLIDYGFSEKALKKPEGLIVTGQQGTWAYLPPEMAEWAVNDGETIPEFSGDKIDIWAAGILLYCAVSGKVPFMNWDDEDDSLILFDIAMNDVMWDIDVSPELLDLLKNILQEDPEKRFSIDEILKHPWMRATSLDGGETFVSRSGKIRVTFNSQAAKDFSSCSKLLSFREKGEFITKKMPSLNPLIDKLT